MIDLMIETLVMVLVIGGIVGAAFALQSNNRPQNVPVKIQRTQSRYQRHNR